MFKGRRVGLAFCAVTLFAVSAETPFSGRRALEFTAKIVGYGPRPSGSQANVETALYIERQLRELPFRISEDAFTAQTPDGPVRVRNIIATLNGGPPDGRILVVTGHFDTKRSPGFVGANDGGSSAGFLLEMAHAVAARKWKHDIRLV